MSRHDDGQMTRDRGTEGQKARGTHTITIPLEVKRTNTFLSQNILWIPTNSYQILSIQLINILTMFSFNQKTINKNSLNKPGLHGAPS